MHLDDKESELLKAWIVTKLENISDADSDVLADYVLALVKTDENEASLRATSVDNLRDFLLDNAEGFVNDVFNAINAKSYDPSRPTPKPSAPVYQPPRRMSFEPPRQPNESRKRSYHDWDRAVEANANGPYQSGERPTKHARRGGRGGGDLQRTLRPSAQSFAATPQQNPMLSAGLQLGLPPFDVNNPFAALMAMQQAMGFAGLPLPPTPLATTGLPRVGQAHQRCRDYDTKGFCARGAACPYEHGENPYIVPQSKDEYDPNTAALFSGSPDRVGRVRSSRGGQRPHVGHVRGGPKRAPFSQVDPNYDRTMTTIVVEQIPEESFEESIVHDFFSTFGSITEIKMQPYKRLAIVEFEDYDSAQAAYESPQVVFGNRFVKIYWYSPEGVPSPPNAHQHKSKQRAEEAQIDMEEVIKRQAAAQRKYEEKMEQRLKVEEKRQELNAKLEATEAERMRLAALLAKKTGKPFHAPCEGNAQTEALRAQLATLEAEAKRLGIDPDMASTDWTAAPSYRGGRGYRGRARGRGYQGSPRGAWAGHGAPAGVRMRSVLDNRPRSVTVRSLDGVYDDFADPLREYLLLDGKDSASLERHPERKDAAIVRFEERYEAEGLMSAAGQPHLAHLGRIELSWYVPEAEVSAPEGKVEDVKMVDAVAVKYEQPEEQAAGDMDTYDADADDNGF